MPRRYRKPSIGRPKPEGLKRATGTKAANVQNNPCVNPFYVYDRKKKTVMQGGGPFKTVKEAYAASIEIEKKTGDYSGLGITKRDKTLHEGDDVIFFNPTMNGKSNMWFPKKGSEAAKDIGSLLQKMRKATGDEKEKLRKLFKETRAKWMARDTASGRKSEPTKKNPTVACTECGRRLHWDPELSDKPLMCVPCVERSERWEDVDDNECVECGSPIPPGYKKCAHCRVFLPNKSSTHRRNSGVIDEHGQWEHCDKCDKFVLIQNLRYEDKSASHPYGLQLCKQCDESPERKFFRKGQTLPNKSNRFLSNKADIAGFKDYVNKRYNPTGFELYEPVVYEDDPEELKQSFFGVFPTEKARQEWLDKEYERRHGQIQDAYMEYFGLGPGEAYDPKQKRGGIYTHTGKWVGPGEKLPHREPYYYATDILGTRGKWQEHFIKGLRDIPESEWGTFQFAKPGEVPARAYDPKYDPFGTVARESKKKPKYKGPFKKVSRHEHLARQAEMELSERPVWVTQALEAEKMPEHPERENPFLVMVRRRPVQSSVPLGAFEDYDSAQDWVAEYMRGLQNVARERHLDDDQIKALLPEIIGMPEDLEYSKGLKEIGLKHLPVTYYGAGAASEEEGVPRMSQSQYDQYIQEIKDWKRLKHRADKAEALAFIHGEMPKDVADAIDLSMEERKAFEKGKRERLEKVRDAKVAAMGLDPNLYTMTGELKKKAGRPRKESKPGMTSMEAKAYAEMKEQGLLPPTTPTSTNPYSPDEEDQAKKTVEQEIEEFKRSLEMKMLPPPWEERENPIGAAIVGGIASGATMALLNRKNPHAGKSNPVGPGGEIPSWLWKRFDKDVYRFEGEIPNELMEAYKTKSGAELEKIAQKYLKPKVSPESGGEGKGKAAMDRYLKSLENPYYVTDRDYIVAGKAHDTLGAAHESKASFDFFAKTAGRHHGGAERYGSPFQVVHSPKDKKEGDYVFDNPNLVVIGNPPRDGIKVPVALERQILRAPKKDQPEILKGVEKFYEFHGCFPKRLIQRNVDHGKMGLPLVNVGLGRADAVEYRSENAASNKFFAGGKGKYVHKFGDELPKGQSKRAKPLLVTDPRGEVMAYLPRGIDSRSRFKVKDWIHH